MKRHFILFSALVLAISFFAVGGTAERRKIIQTDHFETVLTDEWVVGTEENKGVSTSGYVLTLNEIAVNATAEEMSKRFKKIADSFGKKIVSQFGYYKKEIIEIRDTETVLYTLGSDASNAISATHRYVTFLWCDNAIGYLYGDLSLSANPKSDFIDLAQKFRIRTEQSSSAFDYLDYERYKTAEIKPLSYEIISDNGKDYLAIDFSWRNLSDTPSIFLTNFSITAFQNGVELRMGLPLGIADNTTMTKILKDVEFTCTYYLTLHDTSNDVILYINESYIYPDRKPDTIFTIHLSE